MEFLTVMAVTFLAKTGETVRGLEFTQNGSKYVPITTTTGERKMHFHENNPPTRTNGLTVDHVMIRDGRLSNKRQGHPNIVLLVKEATKITTSRPPVAEVGDKDRLMEITPETRLVIESLSKGKKKVYHAEYDRTHQFLVAEV